MTYFVHLAQMLKAIPEPPEVRIGSPEVWASMIEDARIPVVCADAGDPMGRLAGIPILVDATMPANMLRIGERLFVRRADGEWLTMDLAEAMRVALEVRPS